MKNEKRIPIIYTVLFALLAATVIAAGAFVVISSRNGEPELTAASAAASVAVPTTTAEATDETTLPPATEAMSAEAQAPAVPVIAEKRISFLAAGDNVIHPSATTDAKKRATAETRAYNYKPMYENVSSLIGEADIAFINQEILMAGEEYGYSGWPTFNCPQDLGYDLVELGFDIVSIANNHMLDRSAGGLASTIEFWRSLPVTLIGGYTDRSDFENIRIYERDGVKIALLAYTYGTNGISLPAGSELFIPYINDDDITSQISAAREISDIIIVSVHWGNENTFKPSAEQKRLASLMAKAGADVILGHHPHVIQPIEWLDGMGEKKTLCIYSLGNLVGTMEHGYNMVGGFLTFDIVSYSEGSFRIEEPRFIPTVFYFGPSYYNSTLYLMSDFSEELALSHGTKVYGYLDSLETLKSYVTDNIDGEFLT